MAFAPFSISLGLALALPVVHSLAAPPPAIWSDRTIEPAALDKAWQELPVPLRPAAEFQKLWLRIRAGAPVAEWKTEMTKFATSPATDGVHAGLRELAKAWLARAAVQPIDEALRGYYREQVRYPDNLGEIQSALQPEVRQDPWGEPWIYRPVTPHGFAKQARQRYQIGPTRFPSLSPLAEAVKSKPSELNWKVTPRDIAGARAIELRGTDGNAAVLQPGGRAGEIVLIFVGDGWALLGDTERLFTVAF